MLRDTSMEVDKLMTRDVAFCAPTDSLNIAARIMWERDCGCVPVVDKDMVPVGIVTDRDACMGAYTQGLSLHAIQVQTVMAKPALTCAPDDDLITAEKLMRDNKIRRLPVCDLAGRLVGIISLSDFAREAARERLGGKGRVVQGTEVAEVLGAVSELRPHTAMSIPFSPEPGEVEYPRKPPVKRGHANR
jgi:CBS-domain-containing membrane protein